MPTSQSKRGRGNRRSSTGTSLSKWPKSLQQLQHPQAQTPQPARTTSSPLLRHTDSAGLSSDEGSPKRDVFFDTRDNYRDRAPLSAGSHQDMVNAHAHYVELNDWPLTYASLPPTPISPSPPPQISNSMSSPPMVHPEGRSYSGIQPSLSLPNVAFPIVETPLSPNTAESLMHQLDYRDPPFSLWDYLREELLATDFDSHQELKWERVSNFLAIPWAVEKIIGFGFILCLDSFLYTFTILPIRCVLALYRLAMITLRSIMSPGNGRTLPPSQKADILRSLLLALTVAILVPLTDASKIYHSIRGQDTIKLYVIFNALEIADRLCAAIGQDIVDCLFSRSNLVVLSRHQPVSAHTFRPLLFFGLALAYNVAHTLVMIYQMICLNVAINSYDHALLTLLVSNQFVEIKGSVFKKFEKDNLFQIMCADIVERFTLALMLFIVAFRNLIELSGSAFDFTGGFFLPRSFGFWKGNNVMWTISSPVLTVLGSEMIVDWLKHAFITKFNHIRPSVYERYTDVLCRDLASGSGMGRRGARKHSYVDQSPVVARRLGFASLPLAVLAILIGSQMVNLLWSMHADGSASPWRLTEGHTTTDDIVNRLKWAALAALFWICSVVVKIILGVNLISYATRRRAGMEAREAADVVNDFGRDPIGEGEEEKKYNRELTALLNNKRYDAAPAAEIGETKPKVGGGGKEGGGGGGGGKKRLPLEEITRYTMIKRIW